MPRTPHNVNLVLATAPSSPISTFASAAKLKKTALFPIFLTNEIAYIRGGIVPSPYFGI